MERKQVPERSLIEATIRHNFYFIYGLMTRYRGSYW